MCQQSGKRMLKHGKGSILNIGSLASTTALGRGHIADSIAMGGVSQMTKELSTEWSSRGVRVNTVAPAQVLNDSLRKRMEKDPELEKFFLGGIPAGRLGAPNDIKGIAVLFGVRRIKLDYRCHHSNGWRQHSNEQWRNTWSYE